MKFQPGQSGNPGGRPKRKPISDAYADVLCDSAKLKAFAKAVVDKAIAGDIQAAKEVADRLEGRAESNLNVNDVTDRSRRDKFAELLTRAASFLPDDTAPERTQ